MAATHAARVFTSIFPPPAHSTPTPQTTPQIGHPPSPATQNSQQNPFHDPTALLAAETTTSFSTLTRWLSITTTPPPPTPHNTDILHSLQSTISAGLSHETDLITWFREEIRRHYIRSVLPSLLEIWKADIPCSAARDALHSTCSILLSAHETCFARLETFDASAETALFVSRIRDAGVAKGEEVLRSRLQGRRIVATLGWEMHSLLSRMEGLEEGLESLKRAGLLRIWGQKALAGAVKAVVDTFVEGPAMRVDWVGKGSRVPELEKWVVECLGPAVMTCLVHITGNQGLKLRDSDRELWMKMAVNSLGRSRTRYLLQYVQMWDQSLGAILDLKEYIKTPEAKMALADSYVSQMIQGVAHAGAKTSELLSIYVNTIKVFRTLDNRGVLLERVAQSLRSYLRDREDTVKVIAASFLADLDERGNVIETAVVEDVCAEIAREVLQSEEEALHISERALDYDDMEWMPDPIDAGPDFKRSKQNDIISYMLTLFETDNFIKEVQNILGERLLRSQDSHLEKETQLVELFKSRLGTDKLQQCEVMLRDMQDSSRIMTHVRSTLSLPTVSDVHSAIPSTGISFSDLARTFQRRIPPYSSAQTAFLSTVRAAAIPSSTAQNVLLPNPQFTPSPSVETPAFYASILSSFFWPELRDDTFIIPSPISESQKSYTTTFTRLKSQRTLSWLPALGRATVSLELSDRTLDIDDVPTWCAAVIYAFSSPTEETIVKSVSDLETELEMDEILVRNALSFWTGKRVLKTVSGDEESYAVLETLDDEQDVDEREEVVEEQIAAVKTQDAVLAGNKDMYQMFMIGMLTNGGAMDAGRVAMMMKMVVPGGFNFGEDEVRWLLDDLVSGGRCALVGGVYAIKK